MSDLDTARLALACLDFTNLNDDCSEEDVRALIAKASTPFGKVAALCIWPRFVALAAASLKGSGIHLASVVNFPGGDESPADCVRMTRQALTDGADEIDIVLPWRLILQGETTRARDLLTIVARETKGRAKLKVILETGELKSDHLIEYASHIAIESGADFIKTSTGKTPISATPQAARIMLNAIRDSGKDVGFKASGGIRSLRDAGVYLGLCDEIMGTGWASPQHFRIGASGLMDALLERLNA